MKDELTERSQKLRREMTKEERKLWFLFLKQLPQNVYRQKVIGHYIVDFCIPDSSLIIELDGSQHFGDEGISYDEKRDAYLRSQGYEILRFHNGEIAEHFPEVCESIRLHMKGLTMKSVILYTDGACSGNPGPGGWAAILCYGKAEKVLSGGEELTTNNRMELLGVIAGLECLKESCAVALYSDSQYICNALNNGWLRDWKKRGWKRRDGEVKNLELWQRLDELLQQHSVEAHWVKGHAENEYNNRCDALAVAEREKFA